MTDTYTPGPWRVTYYDAGDISHYDCNGPCPGVFASEEQDCAVVHWDGFKQEYFSSANGNQKQIEANARLISTAPELLEALRAVKARGLPDPYNSHAELIEQVDAAIAKATGQ